MAQQQAAETIDEASLQETSSKLEAELLHELGETLRHYQPSAQESQSDLVEGRYRIDPGTPLPELNGPSARAVAAEDLINPGRSLFALICEAGTLQRHQVIKQLKGVTHPNLMTLIASGVERDAAGIDAEVLARHALGWDRAKLIADGRGPAPDTFVARYAPLVDRRSRREPVAMITGRREFWGLDFEVTPDVLIPRPESELIVEAVCARRRGGWPARILDVGTGSGCLAVALAHELPDARLVATDISAAALTVAARNAARHGVAGRIQFVRGNFLAPIAGPVDVVVSNPPYVPATVQLSPDITYYEPAVALYSGLEVLAYDIEAARRYGRLAAALLEQGVPIGVEDAMVAAHALSRGMTLVTHNRKHFERVKGLRVEDWF